VFLAQLFFFFHRESVECFPGTVSSYCMSLVKILVAPLIAGMAKHFIFTEFLYLDFYILISFWLPSVLYSPPSSSCCYLPVICYAALVKRGNK
jgi:hypothetical protein